MNSKYSVLNDKQREAVFHTEGPLLILAGAGSGKTRALTHRIAYLIEEEGIAPYNIMAITFTNKAAEEMKERVLQMVDYGDAVWVATFHSSCVRILRRHIDFLGYDTDFSIYDTDDQKTVLKHVIKELNLDPKMYKERAMASLISACKNEMLTPEDMRTEAQGNYRSLQEARIYEEYEKRLKANNALDFDDLLLKCVELFRENPKVLEYYQDRFQYIMVDEYQDTNHVQFEFVRLLAMKHKNICVVGDDDQSIYRFRGADIRNILEFEEYFPGTKVVKLEQNYRSTTHILDAANAVIRNNRGRKEKHLWSDLGEGRDVTFDIYENGYAEAEEVVRKVSRAVRNGEAQYKDFAVLYRTNAQSRAFEEKCISFNIPYRLVGGVNFYQRAEIKDILAYMKTAANGKDDIATQRIINVPKRGIGQATIDKLLIYAHNNDISLMEAIEHANRVPGIERAAAKLQTFAHLIGMLRHSEHLYHDGDDPDGIYSTADFIREICDMTEYYLTFEDLDEEKAEQKKQNLEELISKAHDFDMNWEAETPPTLTDFLEEVALVADVDAMSGDEDRLLLMTLHSSKGLEFPTVFLCGMEDGLFPSYMSISSGDPMDIEEERRLAYVGITRAMRELHLTAARARTMNGETMYNRVSRFVEEIPEEMLGLKRKVEKKYRAPEKSEYKETHTPPKPTFGRTFTIEKASSLPYDVGDRVHHVKFGDGTVLEIIDGKKDYEVRVNFDTCGEKNMFASFAKLQKIS